MFLAQHISTNHKDLIQDVAYDFHGKRMATCSCDQSVKVNKGRLLKFGFIPGFITSGVDGLVAVIHVVHRGWRKSVGVLKASVSAIPTMLWVHWLCFEWLKDPLNQWCTKFLSWGPQSESSKPFCVGLITFFFNLLSTLKYAKLLSDYHQSADCRCCFCSISSVRKPVHSSTCCQTCRCDKCIFFRLANVAYRARFSVEVEQTVFSVSSTQFIRCLKIK